MAMRRNISVHQAVTRDSFKSRRSMSRSTEASDMGDEIRTPPDDLDDCDENDTKMVTKSEQSSEIDDFIR